MAMTNAFEQNHPPLVVIAGGSSAAGVAVAQALVSAGFRVATVGSDAERIKAAADQTGGALPFTCDLADPESVASLAEQIHQDHGTVDGLIHLVGGWRGGKDLAAQTDADWDFLHHSVLTTLRNTTRTFYADIAASPVGRIAIVSSISVTAPTLGNANYAAIKAAAETWVQALASGLAGETTENTAAAVVLVVKALVDDAMRAKAPERKFPGFTDVAVMGQTVVGLFSTPAAQLNGDRIVLD